ncbi:transcription antitermination factor NusB [Ilumatobacter nonamiensis]|uniref:transcription antitermination factor NusB n=1 Tax=Ilumatobacter nonamiensis TaxID=467093 RepID=UPI0003485429|nr:transcription antitermination factor NusB [Ilumatobacter nonamiensis]
MATLSRPDERSDARERALYLLYEAESKGITPVDALELQVLAPDELTQTIVRGVAEHRDALDVAIDERATGWTLARMPVIDLNVLRIGAFELAHRPEVPTAVVLDEAVNLVKQFSTDDSGRFVNGVLAALVADLRP